MDKFVPSDDAPDNPWRWRSRLVFAIAAPMATAGAVIVGTLAAGGLDQRGCVGDYPCLTYRQQGAQLGPNFDYDGGTVLGTPHLGQKLVFSAPREVGFGDDPDGLLSASQKVRPYLR